MKEWKNDVPENIREFHDALIDFASAIQKTSNLIHAETKTNRMSRGVFFKLHAHAVVLHRSIISLCDNGWGQVTPILLRAMMDVFANLLVISEVDFEYRAYKYFYFYQMKMENDPDISRKERIKLRHELKKGWHKLDAPIRTRIKQFIKGRRFGTYWFNPEYKSPSDVFKKLTTKPSEFIGMYGLYSGASHGGHLSSVIVLDEPDKVDINRRSNPDGAKLAVIASCRHLLDICGLRNEFEELGLKQTYLGLLKRLDSFRPQIASLQQLS